MQDFEGWMPEFNTGMWKIEEAELHQSIFSRSNNAKVNNAKVKYYTTLKY